MKNLYRSILIILMVSVVFPPIQAGYPSDRTWTGNPSSEESAVHERAQKYLDAEVKRDLKAVYGYLAPSSIYFSTHNYETYLAEAESSPVRILEYKIQRIAHIRDNPDKKTYPKMIRASQRVKSYSAVALKR
ncbi:MAG: hypothetical protein NTY16_09350 [Deltaproteobacteria bacterium]|nr:hypothetical protein [Deltaproteobacteria bacterium]